MAPSAAGLWFPLLRSIWSNGLRWEAFRFTIVSMTDTRAQRAQVAGLFDQIAPVYDQGDVPWFRPIAARLVAHVAPQPGDRALDVGAGRGAATFPLARAVGPTGHVTAVDLSPTMTELLRQELAARGVTNVAVRAGEANPDTLEGGTFDVVTASLVLFFDPDPETTLRGWLGLARPGSGRIGVTTFGPIDETWQRAESMVLEHAPGELLDPRTTGTRGPFATTASMTALLEGCGARDVQSRDESLEVVFPDAAAWRTWTMGLGFRAVWNAVPEAERESVFARVAEVLEDGRRGDGRLHLTQQVRYTTGRAR